MTTALTNLNSELTILPKEDTKTVVPLLDTKALVARLLALKSSQFISFLAITEPRHKKTGNPFRDNILKVSRVNGVVNFHYDQNVVKRLAKEGKGEDEFRRGGSYFTVVFSDEGHLTPLAIHKEDAAAVVGWSDVHTNIVDGRPVDAEGKKIPLAACHVKQFCVKDLAVGEQRLYLRFQHLRSLGHEYRQLDNGEIIDKDAVEQFIYESDYSNQGVEEGNELRILTYGLASLHQIALGDDKFRVEVK